MKELPLPLQASHQDPVLLRLVRGRRKHKKRKKEQQIKHKRSNETCYEGLISLKGERLSRPKRHQRGREVNGHQVAEPTGRT
jgi:hypothetical protein